MKITNREKVIFNTDLAFVKSKLSINVEDLTRIITGYKAHSVDLSSVSIKHYLTKHSEGNLPTNYKDLVDPTINDIRDRDLKDVLRAILRIKGILEKYTEGEDIILNAEHIKDWFVYLTGRCLPGHSIYLRSSDNYVTNKKFESLVYIINRINKSEVRESIAV